MIKRSAVVFRLFFIFGFVLWMAGQQAAADNGICSVTFADGVQRLVQLLPFAGALNAME